MRGNVLRQCIINPRYVAGNIQVAVIRICIENALIGYEAGITSFYYLPVEIADDLFYILLTQSVLASVLL